MSVSNIMYAVGTLHLLVDLFITIGIILNMYLRMSMYIMWLKVLRSPWKMPLQDSKYGHHYIILWSHRNYGDHRSSTCSFEKLNNLYNFFYYLYVLTFYLRKLFILPYLNLKMQHIPCRHCHCHCHHHLHYHHLLFLHL
jgi:hypothetical protein